MEDGVSAQEWTVLQVADWLECVGLPQHGGKFRDARIDGRALLRLKSDVLKDKVGIWNLGQRERIVAELRQLRQFSARLDCEPSSPSRSSKRSGARSTPDLCGDESLLARLKAERKGWMEDRKQLMLAADIENPLFTVPTREWSVQQVCDWVDIIGFHQHRKRFMQHSITGDILTNRICSLAALKDTVGISSLEHRQKILARIKALPAEPLQERQDVTAADDPSSLSVMPYKHSTSMSRQHDTKQVARSYMREVDFNIRRLDEKMECAKKRLGLSGPTTQAAASATEMALHEQERMKKETDPNEEWWEAKFKDAEKQNAKKGRSRERYVGLPAGGPRGNVPPFRFGKAKTNL